MNTNGAPRIAANAALAALQAQGCDFLKVGGNMDLIKFLDKNAKQQGVNVESVQFSDTVLKVNKRDKQQKRDLIITTANLYNFKERNYKQCQRAIPITQLKGIVLSAQSDEVLIQVRNDYDYRLLIVRQADAIRILCELYEVLTGTKLNVEMSPDLSKIQILKADVKQRRSAEMVDETSPPSYLLPSSPTHHSGGATITRGASFSNLDGFGSSGIDMRPSMEGWLAKKGQVNLLWRRRYFRLSEANLLYYEARLKGTIQLVEGGEVRAWVNKRLSMNSSGQMQGSSGSTPNSTTSSGLSPLLYEYKLAATYHINPDKHLKDILLDADRFAAFVAFAQTKQAPSPTHSLTPFVPHNESGNPLFYAAVEKFKSLSASETHDTLVAEATKIYQTYLTPTTNTPINAPTTMKAAVGDLLARQTNLTPAAAAASSTTTAVEATPSSAALNSDLFNILQQFVLEYMQAKVLPSYLDYSKESEAIIVKDFKLKNELTDGDKKKPSCYNCLASFGLLKRRYVCKYCGDVFCSNCLSKSAKLPSEYRISEAIKVCDMCYGSLEISHAHPHAFSYANKARSRPIHLAASSPQEQQAWMQAFRNCIQLQQSKGSSTSSGFTPSVSSAALNKEGWLMKEDPTTKIWRRRYFILNGQTAHLYYYELNLKGSLSLSQGAGVHATFQKPTLSQADSEFGGLTSRSSFGFRFNISYNTRLYALSADTEEQMEKWMEALQRAIRRSKPGAGGGLSSLLTDGHKNAFVSPSPSTGGSGGTPSSAEQYSSSFAQKAPEGEVTFVFTDVQNSTKLWELAPEAMNKALEKHDALLRMLLTVFKGYEVKTEGDAFMVTFFNPLDAVRWCLACQEALLEHEWPVDLLAQPSGKQEKKGDKLVFNGMRIRMGIHFGHPACRRNPITGRMDYFGPVVNRSARVSDSAHGGQIVCTAEVRDRMVQALANNEFPNQQIELTDLGTHRYKGITEMVQIYQINNEQLAGRNPFPALRTSKGEEGDDKNEKESKEAAGPTAAVAPGSGIIKEGNECDEEECKQAADALSSAVSPSRPTHITVDSISTTTIHPFTPTALQNQPSKFAHSDHDELVDSDASDDASSEDEEDEEDERLEKERALTAHDQATVPPPNQSPDMEHGFMSPSPLPSPEP